MNKLARIIEDLSEYELRSLRKDIESGNIARLINNRLEEKDQGDPNKVCPVCHSPVDGSSMTIMFGPIDFRRKASFCALDCLEYFIARIKARKGEGNE